MIIVEGPDGTGKTRFAKKVAHHYDLQYRRPPTLSSTKGPDQMVFEWWKEQIRNDDGMGVYDRCFFISEMIYQIAVPDRPLIAEGREFADSVSDLMMLQPLVVMCLPSWEKTRPIITSGREVLDGMSLAASEKVHWAYWGMFGMYYPTVSELFIRDFHIPTIADEDRRLLIAIGKYLKYRNVNKRGRSA